MSERRQFDRLLWFMPAGRMTCNFSVFTLSSLSLVRCTVDGISVSMLIKLIRLESPLESLWRCISMSGFYRISENTYFRLSNRSPAWNEGVDKVSAKITPRERREKGLFSKGEQKAFCRRRHDNVIIRT